MVYLWPNGIFLQPLFDDIDENIPKIEKKVVRSDAINQTRVDIF